MYQIERRVRGEVQLRTYGAVKAVITLELLVPSDAYVGGLMDRIFQNVYLARTSDKSVSTR